MGPYPKAVILAGGRGTRLRTLGQVLPKCLVPVFDKPLLMRQIEQCAQAGVGDVLVAMSARFEDVVRSTLALWTPPLGVVISCVPEAEPLGPISALLSLGPSLANAPSLVLLGDEYYEDSSPFLSLARRTAVPELLVGVVHDSAPQRILCQVVTDGAGRVISLREKPARDQLVGRSRWCGCAGFGAGLLASVPRDLLRHSTHLGDLLSSLITRGSRAEELEFREFHLNLNTAEDALAASLVEARRHRREEERPPLKALDDAIQMLLLAATDFS